MLKLNKWHLIYYGCAAIILLLIVYTAYMDISIKAAVRQEQLRNELDHKQHLLRWLEDKSTVDEAIYWLQQAFMPPNSYNARLCEWLRTVEDIGEAQWAVQVRIDELKKELNETSY